MQKLFLVMISLVLFSFVTKAQQVPQNLNDEMFSTYYQQRVSLFRTLPVTAESIIFLGNSITDGAEWSEIFNNDSRVINRGISGDITAGVLNRLDEVTKRKPSKIFLLIGTNDLAKGIKPDSIEKNICLIAQIIKKETPNTQLYIQSITPVNDVYKMFTSHTNKREDISNINTYLKTNASKYHYTFIDIHTPLADQQDKFKATVTNDGLHLKGDAYAIWKHIIYPYVFDLQKKPALLPLPKKLTWTDSYFPIYKCASIVIQNDSLQSIAKGLQQMIKENGYQVNIQSQKVDAPSILLQIAKVPAAHFSNEAYTLSVKANKIILSANTLHGLYNGVQTLRQLMRANSIVDGCEIKDWPAFAWRGYMVDVGRNYQSVDLLKQQIDVMASLKMNIFHFHLTENVAWRLQIKKYPQLTDAKSMTRNKGLFYSIEDMKDLIHYCKARFITLIPEIDMPGHSDAFKRAMGFDMQRVEGVNAMKNILTEVCDTYDVPYIHIGADEVHISNKNFIPEMEALIENKGKQVIGWEPGGNFSPKVIRQLWGEAKRLGDGTGFKQIDSRNLYINHMDAEESVVSIFNHAICDVQSGDDNRLGATLCLWNDRRLNIGEENLTHNPVYPSMLAFAERCWIGGGDTGNKVYLHIKSSKEYKDFTDFEKRLIDIKNTYFKQLPFAYVKQANVHWKLIGPYDNKGDLAKVFAPENSKFDFMNASNTIDINGATIILKHFWQPTINGLLKMPKPNTTYYAYARYWSSVDTTALMWIGFYDYSRSTASAPPKAGTWNNLQSKIWLNDKIVEPPHWLRVGQDGDLEMPYVDENYSFRMPTKVQLKKGWNKLLLKLPVGSFNSGLWYSPVKWMFTAVFVQPELGSINYKQREWK